MFRTGIVLINFNNVEDTSVCLRSIQGSNVDTAVVVVDNASANNDAEVLAEQFPSIHAIQSHENVGFGRANNIGMRWLLDNTNCEYLFILNNDTTIQQDTVKLLEDALDNDQNAALVTPRILLMDNPELLWYGGGYVDWRTGTAKAPGFLKSSTSSNVLTTKYVDFVSGCAFLIRRSVLEQIGGFDPRFFMYEEDVEFSLRISKQTNFKMLYEPSAVVNHKAHGAQRKGAFVRGRDTKNPRLPFLTYHKTRNRLLNMSQYARGRQALTFILYFPLWLGREFARFIVKGRFDAAKALANGLGAFWQARTVPFHDELRTADQQDKCTT